MPPIVLLHAGVCDRRSWRGVIERLPAREVIAYDRRGFGEAPPASEPFRHVDDLLAMLDEPALLVGSSMGGGVALDAALEAPERVAGLVLIAPAISGDPPNSEEKWVAAIGSLADEIDAAFEAGDVEACNRLEVRLWLDGPLEPEGRVGGAARELALDMNPIIIANEQGETADGASGLDTASRLHEITVPALVACGELDVSFKLARSRELAAALPNGRFVSLPGRAHLPYLENAEEIAELIVSV